MRRIVTLLVAAVVLATILTNCAKPYSSQIVSELLSLGEKYLLTVILRFHNVLI